MVTTTSHGEFVNFLDVRRRSDGDDYCMMFSAFDAYPGLVIWHSKDLVAVIA